MRHKTTQMLLSYFNRIRDGKPAPLRADINPAELKSALPDVFILEMERSGAVRFRLAGMRVCAIMGRELRGEDFNLLWCQTDRHKMKLAAEAVLANQTPLIIDLRGLSEEEGDHRLEMLLLPLQSRAGVCDRFIGSLVDMTTSVYREGENRLLKADGMRFLPADTAPGALPLPDAAPVGGAARAQAAALRNKVMQLRLLQGGRQD